jgi:hypothetical protein
MEDYKLVGVQAVVEQLLRKYQRWFTLSRNDDDMCLYYLIIQDLENLLEIIKSKS